ncbi:MAG: Rne/Rng family ribonuclease [Sphingomonadales bacterium]|nr:Rne/Rng family ribonuclease [Sphingomonadales bacterium]NCO50039.1 Rne/Rng family ribonuclease [Sphingomonadales bacterium]NCO99958.1 Rne/Rng family ribonuclease [Sphingomonadales bacterium]NCP25938.1 Rne/Rng family ribonuclease [Sphingomonadales bacterium]NCP44144.1 Rne/Rng family ribonuclease [Sphingomonadales bacterium]
MTTRMLIDARHQEETRVAVVKGNKIEEFDFESSEHKQLKGNIYLAKVTRVEPSLQAAFVDYGGNRHGFLAFSEIHPDYYQIPREDREKLLAEEAEHAAEEAALRAQEEEDDDSPADMVRSEATEELDTALVEVDKDDSVDTIDVTEGEIPEENGSDEDDDDDDSEDESSDDNDDGKGKNDGRRGRGGRNKGRGKGSMPKASDQARQKRMALRKRYKIQDVIQRRQVVLVQVVKEERGNKGAALTTYLSLAGRYCVLMPNTSHGGGISRKINNVGDRKRLKSIIADLKLPTSMGCIVRTAGLSRTKPEIKRDFDYLARLWDEIREKTLSATAPSLIHSDSDLVKRAIRDIYNREIEEVLVEGANGYTAAKNFMKLLMPSHSKRVKSYADPVSLFQRYGVEDQLSAMYSPEVQLKSGGYLVINPTEALVSIDINSGRSTREHGIEATAVKTNMEAAAEIARQLRLRDMAGLVVIDFIDMDRSGNVRKVERAMRDALKNDRARIQVGRISSFGLMEMSRQRLRTGVLEASTKVCPHCEGTGLVRTASSSALSALRLLEEEAAKGKASQISLRTSQEACIYVLNSKRQEIEDIEQRYGVSIEIVPDGETEGARMEIQTSGSPPKNMPKFEPIIDDDDDDDDHIEEEAEVVEAEERQTRGDRPERAERTDRNDGEERPKRKRRRRGRRNRGGDRSESAGSENDGENNSGNSGENNREAAAQSNDTDTSEQAEKPKPRSRRNSAPKADSAPATTAENSADDQPQTEAKPRGRRRSAKSDAPAEQPVESKETPTDAAEEKPKRRRAPRKAKATSATSDPQAADETADATGEKKPPVKRAPRARAKKADNTETSGKAAPATAKEAKEKAPAKPRKARPTAKPKDEAVAKTSDSDAKESSDGSPRQGWWQRTFG